ncbi:hypothetical protein B0H14DRAFT_2636520 [Mycena olivaceomarginata]|nr:hypothetical protein B0H14DRAFT_2636520 [Mycena olivaceomarginata]
MDAPSQHFRDSQRVLSSAQYVKIQGGMWVQLIALCWSMHGINNSLNNRSGRHGKGGEIAHGACWCFLGQICSGVSPVGAGAPIRKLMCNASFFPCGFMGLAEAEAGCVHEKAGLRKKKSLSELVLCCKYYYVLLAEKEARMCQEQRSAPRKQYGLGTDNEAPEEEDKGAGKESWARVMIGSTKGLSKIQVSKNDPTKQPLLSRGRVNTEVENLTEDRKVEASNGFFFIANFALHVTT